MVTGAVMVVVVIALPPPRLRHQPEPLGVARLQVPFVGEPDLLRVLDVCELHKGSFWLPILPELRVCVWQHLHCCAGDARGVTATMLLADVAADEQRIFIGLIRLSPCHLIHMYLVSVPLIRLSVQSSVSSFSATDPSFRSI